MRDNLRNIFSAILPILVPVFSDWIQRKLERKKRLGSGN